ncbi:hypothetical protein CYK37_00075 [Mesorhizobium loti]|nr:hypothetical protein [Mesorhizobium loti]PLP60755.1 hypothetical protein CYK37_00075 [Mesorhizobium loti]
MFRRYALLVFILLAAAMFFGNAIDTQNLWASTKPLLQPLASVYLNTFNSPATAILLCALMVALAATLSFYYSSGRIWPTQRDLNTLRSELSALEGSPGSQATVEGIRRSLERRPRFQRAWRLYLATLVTDADNRTWSSFQPSRTFNMRMLEHEGLRIRFYLGLPNDFVGLGLVFTFLGLVAGLYFASRSMMSADLTQAREALIQLLHAATFKFLTSIVGIAISLILSAIQRLQVERIQSSLDEVQLRLEELLPPLSAQSSLAIAAANEPRAIRSIAS